MATRPSSRLGSRPARHPVGRPPQRGDVRPVPLGEDRLYWFTDSDLHDTPHGAGEARRQMLSLMTDWHPPRPGTDRGHPARRHLRRPDQPPGRTPVLVPGGSHSSATPRTPCHPTSVREPASLRRRGRTHPPPDRRRAGRRRPAAPALRRRAQTQCQPHDAGGLPAIAADLPDRHRRVAARHVAASDTVPTGHPVARRPLARLVIQG